MKRMLQKWDPRRRTYLPYMIPGNWNVSIFEWDLETVVTCAGCGQRLSFGDSYTSRQIHTTAGIGYAVCRKCYDREWNEEKRQREAEHVFSGSSI